MTIYRRRRGGYVFPTRSGGRAELHTEYAANRDRRVRTQLLANYDTFAVALARRFPSRRDSAEDLAQVARVGLLHALERFDPALGRPFTIYARATIVGELKRH